jgi:hypothetical protein
LSSGDFSLVDAALSFFEGSESPVTFAHPDFWRALLGFFLRSHKFQARAYSVIMKFAKNPLILPAIADLKNLEEYIHPISLDLFLYVVCLIPECLTDDCVSKFELFAIRSGSTECFKALVILCKLTGASEGPKKRGIIDFFRGLAKRYVDVVGGHLILRQLFVDSKSFVTSLLPLYVNSKVCENAVAAYHCILVSDIPCDFLTADVLCSHLTKNAVLCECAVDLLRRRMDQFCSREIIGGLISAYMLVNADKPILLMCELAQKEPGPFFELAPKWMAATQNQAIAFLKVLIILAKDEVNLEKFENLRALPGFVSEILKCGPVEAFVGVCWFLCQLQISKRLWQQLDRAAVFHLLGQKLKSASEVMAIKFGANVFQKLATINYSSGFGVVVQVLLKRAQEVPDAASDCVKALGELVKHNELKSVFRLFNAAQNLEKFKTFPELMEVVGIIILNLRV